MIIDKLTAEERPIFIQSTLQYVSIIQVLNLFFAALKFSKRTLSIKNIMLAKVVTFG